MFNKTLYPIYRGVHFVIVMDTPDPPYQKCGENPPSEVCTKNKVESGLHKKVKGGINGMWLYVFILVGIILFLWDFKMVLFFFKCFDMYF